MSYNAYTKTQNLEASPGSGRDVEYRLLGQVTAALMDAEAAPTDVAKRVDTVCWNREVWAVFRLDLSNPDNGLPLVLKTQLIDLSHWVDRETFRILNSETIALDGLIDVNKHIIEGLKPKSRVAEPAAVAS